MRILTWKRGQGLHMLPMLQQKAGGSVERRLTEINFNKLTWQLEPGAGDDLDMNNFQCSSKVESRGLEIAWYSHEAKLPSSTRSGSWNARRGSGNVPVTFCITRLGRSHSNCMVRWTSPQTRQKSFSMRLQPSAAKTQGSSTISIGTSLIQCCCGWKPLQSGRPRDSFSLVV